VNPQLPRLLATIGGVLISASGVLSLALGLRTGSLWYEPDPNGIFGHIGILAGLAAMAIGALIVLLARTQYAHKRRRIIAGILTMVLGHLGAIAGALLVGTAGTALCYIAGVWLIIVRNR
jgi:putative Mn2+ efflux pump MntP